MTNEHLSSNDNCYFCKDFSSPEQDTFFLARLPEVRQKSRLLQKTEDMWLFPDMSPVVDNHVLLSPTEHFTSFAVLPDKFNSQISRLCNEVRSHSNCKDIFMFEHGMGILENNIELCGNSVFHAHMHIIPITDEKISSIYDIAFTQANKIFGNNYKEFIIPSDKDISNLLAKHTEGKPYLFIRRGDDACVFIENEDLKIPSQFLRKICAEAINGQNAFWDRKNESQSDIDLSKERILKIYRTWSEIENKSQESLYDFSNINLESLTGALKEFEGYHKLESILILKALGFPIAGGIVVKNFDSQIHNELIRDYPDQIFGIRTDKISESVNLPRGGYEVNVNDLNQYLPEIVQKERVVILIKTNGHDHPTRYDHAYSINLNFQENNLLIEILGKGFDNSDLNRGDITPHQIFSIPLDFEPNDITPWLIYKSQLKISSNEEYKQSIEMRLKKIGLGLTEGRRQPLNDNQAIENGRQMLEKLNKTALLNKNTEYRPIDYDQLTKIIRQSYFLPKYLNLLGKKSDNFVLSCSIFLDDKINYWDIVFPENKFKL